ncbi:hypothetical protein FB561_0034 [Kribbella amoyensis]|uniref:Uncharacterized protein n=1 Tax=Kribbella amoyensis TaxID=996641 RepID=A0A561BJE6_9ACTN|nr:hypothetical protein [Kribbella amoyensis]TWD78986.1 hypothetical protein FB561_0034 [Kribbella amoyensis]
MENDAREQLRILERAEAAPYISYPPTPRWYAPAIGAWAAAFIGAFTWWRENTPLFAASLAGLILLELVFVTWMQRRHGALPMPGRGRPPAEIGRVWSRYFVGLLVVCALVGLAWWRIGVAAGAATAFVTVTAGLAYYEYCYAQAAAEVRKRLG